MKNTIGVTADLEAYKKMKTRILTAAVLTPIMLLVLLAAPEIVAAIIVGLMMAVGAYELLFGTRLVRHPRMVLWSALMAFATTMWSYFDSIHAYAVIGMVVFVVLLFAEMMNDHVKVHFQMVGMCIMAGLVVPYLITAVIRILMMTRGRYLVLTPCVVAFLNDAGAYFIGKRFGKHKLAPVVSPNKTIEGVAGGLIFAVVGMILYGVILHALGFRINYFLAVLYGILGGGIGVFGDLCFSVIKRQTGIKDYGNLMPGHGGVMDRFDSMMTVAPVIEALLILCPFAVVG